MEPATPIVDLRRVLNARFPHLRFSLPPPRRSESVATGIAQLDALLGGGIPRGAFTELVATGHSSGSAAIIRQFIRHATLHGRFVALIDGLGSFDLEGISPEVLRRLLWIRCRNTHDALQATDLLLRDRNVPICLLDLKINPLRELRRLNASSWHRYKRLVELNRNTVLVLSPHPLVSGATCRIELDGTVAIEANHPSNLELLSRFHFRLLRAAGETAGLAAG
ncbi:MAG: hypothetical protein U1G07_14295 [Verrucomicrobiota bacterium]